MKLAVLAAAVLAASTGMSEASTGVCAGSTTTYGIDVSRYQGDIDWTKVAGSGVKFAFIQISRSLTDIDAKFPDNWQHAKDAGVLRGAYQRFHPGQDVIGQANVFLSKLGPFQAGDLPPVLDVEDTDGLGGTAIASAVRQWVEYVEQHLGVRPIIYTNFYFWRDFVGGADFHDYLLWIANYGSSCPMVPAAWTGWTFHQYSSTATVPGIATATDVNTFDGSLAELQALTKPACDQVIDGTTEAASIVDDESTCFFAGGDPQYIRTESAGFGSSLRWTHTTENAEASNYGRWDLTFAAAGRYRVEAYTAAPYAMSKQAVYQVRHAGTLSEVAVDQTSVDGWSFIGEMDFAAGGDQLIRLDDNTGELNSSDTKLVFDAMRFTLLTDDTGKEDGDTDPPVEDPPEGGCSTGHSGGRASGGPLLLLALLFVRRKRR